MTKQEAKVTFREFQSGDAGVFRKLSEEWIKSYFTQLEAEDEAAIADPEKTVLNGGRIFFAIHEGQTVGCCALLALRPGEFEVAKMAVAESARGAGIGRQLLARIIAEAAAMGAKRLYLETNHKLAPAIRLYESVGFRHLEPERIVPSRYARADVYMELWL
jgi:putative acetyltransferase